MSRENIRASTERYKRRQFSWRRLLIKSPKVRGALTRGPLLVSV